MHDYVKKQPPGLQWPPRGRAYLVGVESVDRLDELPGLPASPLPLLRDCGTHTTRALDTRPAVREQGLGETRHRSCPLPA